MRKSRYNSALFASISGPVMDAAKKALAEGARRVVEKAKENCPIKTGNLRDSIHTESRKEGSVIRVVADAVNEKDGIYYGKIVEFSPKINRPYLYPAIESERERIMEDIRAAIVKGLEKEVKK